MGAEVSRSCGGGPTPEEMKKLKDYDLMTEEKARILSELEANKKLAEDYVTYKSRAEPAIRELTTKEKRASDRIIELEAAVRDLNAEKDALKSQLDERQLKIKELDSRLSDLYARLGAASAGEEKNSSEAQSLGMQLRKTEDQVAQLQHDNTALRSELSNSRETVKSLQEALANLEAEKIALLAKLLEFVSASKFNEAYMSLMMQKIAELEAEAAQQRESRERRLGQIVVEAMRKKLSGKELEEAKRNTEAARKMREEARKAADEAQRREEEERLARLDAEPVQGTCSLTMMDLFNVRMTIDAARKLLPDAARQRNPFVTVKVNDASRKTKVKQGTTEPEWRQPFGFITEKMPKQLRFDVWDHDQEKDDAVAHLGGVTVALTDLFSSKSNGEMEAWMQLDVGEGELHVKITCRRVPQVALRWSTGYGHEDIAKVLRFAKADIEGVEKGGRSLLMQAAVRDQADVARTLLIARAAIEARDQASMTPLMLAASHNAVEAAEVLLAFHANIEATDAAGRTALIFAAKSGSADVARLLLQHNADVGAVEADGRSVLLVAATEGHAPVVELLLKAKANVNQRDNSGLSPLMMAAVRDYPQVAQSCIDNGADVELRDGNGLTPLMIAAVRGNVDVARVLLQAKAAINAKEDNGRTPLMFAAHRGKYDMCRLLLEAGADTELVDEERRTAKQIAVEAGQAQVVRLLDTWSQSRGVNGK